MPVFTETSSAWRDLRTLPSYAPPLPRLTPPAPKNVAGKEEKYDVVVVGAGPAGLFLTTLLARYGLSDDSMICFDSKPGTLKAGQADGLQPRTLEVLQSLNLAHEILTESCHIREVAFWNPKGDQKLTTSSTNGLNGIAKTDSHNSGIERTSFVPDVAVPARFQHEITIHQGRIERILDEDLRRYSNRGIVRSTQFSKFEIDAASDPQYPLKITVSTGTGECSDRITKTVRAKYLVGADGAHSRVRHDMGLLLEGETTDHIWGVLDFVADTNFPDVRKRCAIHSDAGSIMIIPRERICTGEYLTRLYVQIMEEVPTDVNEKDTEVSETHKANSKQRRSAITQEAILAQAEKVMYPFKINVKSGTKPDWFAAYQIGQRMAPEFCLRDAEGIERVFIVGDACHTHSPKAGQGMNVSMMDSYNLSWKLAHCINGLSPKLSGNSDLVLPTFNEERVAIAKQLIDFDTKFSSMFSGQIGDVNTGVGGLTHEEFLKIFLDGSGFTSGCGIEYPPSQLVRSVQKSASITKMLINGTDFLGGSLKAGRRVNDCIVTRYADANPRHLQDELSSIGRYRILVFAAENLASAQGPSALCLGQLCEDIIPRFPQGVVEILVIFPSSDKRFEWVDLPPCLKREAEMRFYSASNEIYAMYGVDTTLGAIVLVRPDGYVGTVCALEDTCSVMEYLGGCLVVVGEQSHKE